MLEVILKENCLKCEMKIRLLEEAVYRMDGIKQMLRYYCPICHLLCRLSIKYWWLLVF